MKKLLTLTAVGAILAAPATAVQKCVALDPEHVSCYPTSEEYSDFVGKAEWSITCTTNGTSVPIKGIGMCSNQAANDFFDTSEAITTVSSESDMTDRYCWCKMVEPAVSSWVYIGTDVYGGDRACAYGCAASCFDTIYKESGFQSALFGSLAN
ncbi:MAG: hypothetical protein E7009_01585 [Alphaproteobacteria bacterium]|nr:hypothetical protein [Alphaproteobacteria bacterium]